MGLLRTKMNRAVQLVANKAGRARELFGRFTRDREFRARHLPRIWRTFAVVWYGPLLLWHCTKLSLLRGRRRQSRTVAPGAQPRIVMLVFSYLPSDARVEREAKTLVSAGFEVTIVCPEWSPPGAVPDWGPHIAIRIIPSNGVLHRYDRYFPYVYDRRLLQAALAEDAWAYHAHDLKTALPALLAATQKRVPCVCDFHDWSSEGASIDEATGACTRLPLVKRAIFRLVESVAIRRAAQVVTVSDSIATRMATQFRARQRIEVIRNIPHLNRSTTVTRWRPMDLRAELALPPQTRIVLFHGPVGPACNLEPVIRAIANVPNVALVIRGPGVNAFGAGYKQLAAKCGCGSRVFWLPPVPSAEAVLEAQGGDIGLWTVRSNVGLNAELTLPDAVFEYLMAGVPILVADLPETRRLVNRYQIGLAFDPVDPRKIAQALTRLVDEPEVLAMCRANIPRALDDMQAGREWQKLVGIYRRLVSAAPREVGIAVRPLPEARQAA
jgi:glycosyltransferase involved in cell wall biosynthesis